MDLKTLKIKVTSFTARKLPVKTARLASRRPIASITFDDFPKSAWTIGGPVLAGRGVRGTYYTAGGFCGRTVNDMVFYDGADLNQLVAAGHELGCHGFGHQPTPSLTSRELVADTERNREFLKGFNQGAAPVSYAFPFGKCSVRTKLLYAPRFSNLRGVHPGVNVGRADLAQLNVISLETRCWEPDQIEAAIARVRQEKGWLILYTHDVSDAPSPYGSTPQMLDWALERVAAAGIDVLPMKEALPVALGA